MSDAKYQAGDGLPGADPESFGNCEKDSPIHVYPVGAVTVGQAGETVTDIEGMVKAGAKAISEDGKSVMNAAVYEKAMKEAARLGIPVMAHCEDKNLVGKGAMNAGKAAERLGIPELPMRWKM